MTLRESHTAIIEHLRSMSSQIGVPAERIETGRYGEIPSDVPCIWVFTEPSGKSDSENIRHSLLKGESLIGIVTAHHFDGNEVAEKIWQSPLPFAVSNIGTPQFEGVYGDFSITTILIEFRYKAAI